MIRVLVGAFVIAASVLAPGQQRSGHRVDGRVVDTTSSTGVAYAQVELRPIGSGELVRTVSDRNGAFTFTGLAAGRYEPVAAKSGYVRTPWRVGQPPRVVNLHADRSAFLSLQLAPGAAIVGVVTTGGNPLSGAQVRVLRCNTVDTCEPAFGIGTSAETSGSGAFRLFGLPAGAYAVVAHARLTSDSNPVLGTPADAIRWAEDRLAGRRASGAPPSSVVRSVAWVPTYAPGVTTLSAAVRIQLAPGIEVTDVEIPMVLGQSGRVRGTASSAIGAVPRGLYLFPDQWTPMAPPATVLIGPEGRFESAAVPPGLYRLVGKSEPGTPNPTWAERRLQISGDLDHELDLVFQPALELFVNVSVDGVSPAQSALGALALRLRRTDVGITASNVDVVTATRDIHGRFVATGLLPGSYALEVLNAGRLWPRILTSSDGKDALEHGLVVTSPASATDLVLQLSTTPSSVAGDVRDADDVPAVAYMVVAFAALRDDRTARRIAHSRVAEDGSYVIRGLPEGDYFLGLVGSNDPADLTPELLDALATVSQPVSVVWGQETRQNLRLPTR